MKGLHRDDIDVAVLEKIQAESPDTQIVCIGDAPDKLPDEVKKAIVEFDAKCRQTLVAGECFHCRKVMPNWPPDSLAWNIAEGWGAVYADGDDQLPNFWSCPDCCDEHNGETLLSFVLDDKGNVHARYRRI